MATTSFSLTSDVLFDNDADDNQANRQDSSSSGQPTPLEKQGMLHSKPGFKDQPPLPEKQPMSHSPELDPNSLKASASGKSPKHAEFHSLWFGFRISSSWP